MHRLAVSLATAFALTLTACGSAGVPATRSTPDGTVQWFKGQAKARNYANEWDALSPGLKARLSRAARRVIESRSSRLVVSAVSAWELSTKHRLGKLPQADVLLGAYTQHLDRLGVLRLPVARTTRCWPAGCTRLLKGIGLYRWRRP